MNRLRRWWDIFLHEIKKEAGPAWVQFRRKVLPNTVKSDDRPSLRVINGGKK